MAGPGAGAGGPDRGARPAGGVGRLVDGRGGPRPRAEAGVDRAGPGETAAAVAPVTHSVTGVLPISRACSRAGF